MMKLDLTRNYAASARWEPAILLRSLALPGILALLLFTGFSSFAQGTTVTSNPADGATGVSVSGPVVFTFSAAMNTSGSSAVFITPPSGFYPVSSIWSAGNTVLTCTPLSPFPANTAITWNVFGTDAGGGFVTGTGSFTTGTGTGGGGGSGTNAITTFSAGKLFLYEQLTAGAPTPFSTGAYAFDANVSLASNRTATAVTVMVPGASTPDNLQKNFSRPEDWFLFGSATSSNSLETSYPQGNYAFNITGTPADLQATVTLPAGMVQPNAPQVSNFAAAQTINATNGFTLQWDPFVGGTSTDAIGVTVSDGTGKTLFQTATVGAGALKGTATSVLIPAGTLAADSTNTAEIVFYRFVTSTNTDHATLAFRASGTEVNLITTGAVVVGVTPVVTNPSWGPNGFGFDVATTVNQALKVRFSTDCSLPISQWQTVLTTNSPGTSVHLVIPAQVGASGFFRVQNGP